MVQWQHAGLQVNRSSDHSCTRGMIHNKIHLICQACPGPSISILNRDLKQHSFLSIVDIIVSDYCLLFQAFDDVVRKVKPKDNLVEYKKRLVLDQEKSKESLAAIYEQEFIKQTQTVCSFINCAAGEIKTNCHRCMRDKGKCDERNMLNTACINSE